MLVDDYFRLKRDKKLPGMTLSQHLFAHEVRVPNEAIQLDCSNNQLTYQEFSKTLFRYDFDEAR